MNDLNQTMITLRDKQDDLLHPEFRDYLMEESKKCISEKGDMSNKFLDDKYNETNKKLVFVQEEIIHLHKKEITILREKIVDMEWTINRLKSRLQSKKLE